MRPEPSASDERLDVRFYVVPPAGRQRDARGLVSRALRAVLGPDYTCAPYFVEYQGARKRGAELGRYAADLTSVEAEAVWFAIEQAAKAEGWRVPPCAVMFGDELWPRM